MPKKEDKKTKDELQSAPELQLELEAQELERGHSVLHLPTPGTWSKTHCCGGLLYIVLSVLAILLSIVETIVSAFGATSERFYEAPQSGRMVAMIVLAVTGPIVISALAYAIVGVKKKNTKPLHTTTIVLLVLVVIQALILGISVHVSEIDELGISRSLSESFFRAKDGDLSQRNLWDVTHSGLECCGLYGPEDYRDPYGPVNFPPDIPPSCCASYNSPNTTLDKELEMCKAHRSYYKSGCKLPVLEIVRGASVSVIIVTLLLIIAELVLAIFGAILSHKRKEEKHEHIEFTPTQPKAP